MNILNNKYIERISFVIILIFAGVGLFVFSTLIHELSHKQDFQSLDINEDYICALQLPSDLSNWDFNMPVGYYFYKYNTTPENIEKVIEIKEYTERKAVVIEIIVHILFFVAVFYFILYRILSYLDKKEESKDLNTLSHSL